MITNDLAPVKEIMRTDLITVSPADNMLKVKEIFEKYRFHHLPVVEYKKLVGMLSKTDYYEMCIELAKKGELLADEVFYKEQVKNYMTTGLAKIQATERVDVAALIFKDNRFHALPVVSEAGELEGLITPFDIVTHSFVLTETY